MTAGWLLCVVDSIKEWYVVAIIFDLVCIGSTSTELPNWASSLAVSMAQVRRVSIVDVMSAT